MKGAREGEREREHNKEVYKTREIYKGCGDGCRAERSKMSKRWGAGEGLHHNKALAA